MNASAFCVAFSATEGVYRSSLLTCNNNENERNLPNILRLCIAYLSFSLANGSHDIKRCVRVKVQPCQRVQQKERQQESERKRGGKGRLKKNKR